MSEKGKVKENTLKVVMITLSDRVVAGVYDDRSGALAEQLVTDFFNRNDWKIDVDRKVLPDKKDLLKKVLQESIDAKSDIIFTIGSTGIGSRDIAPEAVQEVGDKVIPGIMEGIRIKYAKIKPFALLSRSIACVAGKTQIYTLPGSVKAVEEYLREIFSVLEHAIFMINDVGH